MKATRRRKPCQGARDSGFTLVELLVASSITVLMAGMLLLLADRLMVVWSRNHSRLVAEAAALRVLDQLTVDLQGMVRDDEGGAWLAATVQPGTGGSGQWVGGAKPQAESLKLDGGTIREARFGVAGVWLRFFTVCPGGLTGTGLPPAPVAVAYQIIRRPPTPGDQACHYLFYRSEARSTVTLAAGFDLTAAGYRVADGVEDSTGSLVNPSYRALIADDVVDFGVRFYGFPSGASSEGREPVQLFPDSSGTLEYAARSTDSADVRPVMVDVMLRILTEEGARRIAAIEDGHLTGNWWTVVEANSWVFTRRILLPGEER